MENESGMGSQRQFSGENEFDPEEEGSQECDEQAVDLLAQSITRGLRNGEVCYVRRADDGFQVDVYPTLRQDYPELYGFLLALNQRILSTTGCLWGFTSILAAVLAIVGIYEFVPNLGAHGWWAYPLVVLGVMVIWGVGNNRAESSMFRRHTEELSRLLARHGIGRYRLIEWLSDDARLQAVAQRLKESTDWEQ